MDNVNICKIVCDYATSTNYEGAIMITAEWGTGKSYFLQNELIPYLQKQGIKTLVVSLHGVKSHFEISKAIYVEYLFSNGGKRKPKNNLGSRKKKEIVSHSTFAAKTIIKGVASYFNIDLSCSKEELEKLYKSIDISNTLIIFEDFERSLMDPEELLAFVNNLVEYDRVKTILIANENALKKHNQEKYNVIKEKTIGDTIHFVGDPIIAIGNMFKQFSKERIWCFLKEQNTNNDLAMEIVKNISGNQINLRSILFGIEKFNELMSAIDWDVDKDYEKNVLISCLTFVHKYRKNNTIVWNNKEEISNELSSFAYPLHRFTYDFIVFNELDISQFKTKETEYKEYKAITKAKNDLNDKLSVLYNCYIETEERVKEVIVFIRDSLKSIKIIPFELYFKIANYLIYIKYVIKYNEIIDECLDLMLSNIKRLKEERFDELAVYGGIALDNKLAITDYENFKEKASSIVKKNKMNPLVFSYNISDLDSFCEQANKSRDSYFAKRGFAIFLDVDRFVELMKKCSALQLNEIRGVFINVYFATNIKEFFLGDKDNIDKLHDKMKELEHYKGFDCIQINQIKMFSNNLADIITKLERGY